MASARIDLSRLNHAERQALRLLAQGHTAKSIANTIGSTPLAVNERLREARRKTGVGSSRELARMLKAQENRHELMAMGNGRSLASSLSQPDAEIWRPQMGVFAMFGLLALTAAGAAAFLMQAQPIDEPKSNAQMITDPDLGTFAVDGPAWLYPLIRKEGRDLSWAPVAERVLRERYSTVLFFGTKPRVLRVTCRTRTCEIAASISGIQTNASYGQAEASIVRDMRRQGLIQTGAIVSGDTKSPRAIYLAYYLRAKR
jgi:DNA-binding CsgD family transcriptional regulator